MADIPLLSGIFDAAKWWGDNVVEDKVMGHGLRMVDQGLAGLDKAVPLSLPVPGGTGNIPLGMGLGHALLGSTIPGTLLGAINPAQDDLNHALNSDLTGKAWVDAAYHKSPWQRFFAGAALDPMNLVGLGLPGKLATAVPAGTKLASALKVADYADKAPGLVSGKAIDAVGGAGRGALQLGADALGPLVPHNPALDRIGNAFGKTMSGWREQALTSPAFHANNWAGNVELAARSGQWDVLRKTALAPFTGRDTELDDILARLGNNRAPVTRPPGAPPPVIDPASFGSRWSDQMEKIGRQANVNNPYTSASVFRDIPNTNVVGNTVRDKVAGFSEANKRFGANRIEGPAIDAAFSREFAPAFRQNSNEFFQDLQRFRDPATGARPPEVQQAIDQFRSSRGQMSPDDLREILEPGSRARRAAYAANPTPRSTGAATRPATWQGDLVKNWEDRVISSLEPGSKNSTGIFFDYTANNPIDKLGQNAFAFHRFAINNLPKSLRSAGERPVNALIPSHYYDTSDRYNQQRGLPGATWHGKMPLGEQLPGGMQATFDPMGILPFGGLVKAATRPDSMQDEQGNALGQFSDDLKGLGLGLNPFLDAGLTVSGAQGRALAPGFLRASQPVNGILSAVLGRPVDIEGGSKELFGNAQEALGHGRPFPYQEYLLNKRQAELKALGENPAQAGQDVGRQMGVEGLLGFAGIPGLKLLTPEEQTIRQNQKLAAAYKTAGITQGAKANPTAGAYSSLYPEDQQIANWGSLSAADRERLFKDPSVRDKLLAQLAMQLHNTGSKASPNPLVSSKASKGSSGQYAQQAARVIAQRKGARG